MIAAEIDAATERIVTYLAGFDVPVNVVFFRYFRDDEREYLARSWLLDEAAVAPGRAGAKTGGTREPWNGHDWYVSFGEEDWGRNWDDARKYGFVSAGGRSWYSKTLRGLPVGARIFAYIPQAGYVGLGTTTAVKHRSSTMRWSPSTESGRSCPIIHWSGTTSTRQSVARTPLNT